MTNPSINCWTVWKSQGKLDDTVVMYISDNGQFWGEHRGIAKQWAYEEASHVPFALRYPGLVASPRVEDRLVANIDIAPTIYELAGLPIPPDVDGRSLLPLLTGTTTWRDDIMIETASTIGHYYAVHTGRYVYVTLRFDQSELYDLQTDPYQLRNLINDDTYTPIVNRLKARLDQILGTLGGNTVIANDIANNPSNDFMQRKMVQASTGTVAMFDQFGTRGEGGIRYTYARNGTAPNPDWSTPTLLNPSVTDMVAVAQDSGNNIYLVVSQPRTTTGTTPITFQKLTYVAANDVAGSGVSPWTAGPIRTITPPPATTSVCCASIAIDSRGTAWVVSRFFDGSLYQSVVQSASGPNYETWSPRIALDTPSVSIQRLVSVVAHGGKVSVVYNTGKAYASRWRDDTAPLDAAWNAEQVIETGSLGSNGLFSVAGDVSGNLHLAYNSATTSNVKYRRWDAATRAWTGASVVSTRPASGTYGAASVTTAGDEVYVFVQYAVGSNQSILTVRRQVDGKWEPSEQVLTDPWERTFDQVWSTSGAEWHDLTAAAASVASNDLVHPATNALLRSPDDAVYAGMSERFDYAYTALSTTGRGGSYVWEYWNGAAWTTLPLRENSGPGFTTSGAVRFRPPHDWQSAGAERWRCAVLRAGAGGSRADDGAAWHADDGGQEQPCAGDAGAGAWRGAAGLDGRHRRHLPHQAAYASAAHGWRSHDRAFQPPHVYADRPHDPTQMGPGAKWHGRGVRTTRHRKPHGIAVHVLA